MENKLASDLANSLEASASLRKEASRFRQQRKRTRWDGPTAIQRRTALVLYVMTDFAIRSVLYCMLQIMGL